MPELTTEVVAEKDLAKPVVRPSVTKVALPQIQHFTVILGGKEYCVRADLESMPKEVQDYILALGEAQAEHLLKG